VRAAGVCLALPALAGAVAILLWQRKSLRSAIVTSE
jgi:hypothetical protein